MSERTTGISFASGVGAYRVIRDFTIIRALLIFWNLLGGRRTAEMKLARPAGLDVRLHGARIWCVVRRNTLYFEITKTVVCFGAGWSWEFGNMRNDGFI